MKQQSHSIKALGYFLTPVILACLAALVVYGTMTIIFPEEYTMYEVLLTVFSYFTVLFYLVSTLPCAVMAVLHSIFAMVKDRKFVWPIAALHLNLLNCGLFVYVVYLLFVR